MYINLTEDQLDTLYTAMDLALDDYREQVKYTMDKEDMDSLSAAAKALKDLRAAINEQTKAAKDAGTNQIHVVLSIEKDALLREANQDALEDAISQELDWLHDSGMFTKSWAFAYDTDVHEKSETKEVEPQITDGTLKLPPEKVDMLNFCLTHNMNEIADQYGAIGDDPQVWFDFTPQIEAILTLKILEGRTQLQMDLMLNGEPYADSRLIQADNLEGAYTFTSKDGRTFNLVVEKDPEQQRVGRPFLFHTDATDLPKTAAYFNGKTCTVLEQIEPKLDYEPLAIGEMMWRVKFPGGEILDAFDSELQPLPRKLDLTSQVENAEGKRTANVPGKDTITPER